MLCFLHPKMSSPKKISGLSSHILMLTFLIIVSVCADSFPQGKTGENSLPKWVAGKYGINSFSDIQSIGFTFNIRNDGLNVKRSWVWEPKTGKVIYNGPDINEKSVEYTYNRHMMDTSDEVIKFIDSKFINDQYWLLFPFHLVWDTDLDITIAGKKQFPISDESGTELIVTYKNNTGYTPNDVYKLFLSQDNMIREWIYLPGGDKDKQRVFTWEQNRQFDGITIATEHYGYNNKTKIWFTDIRIETSHTYK